MARVTLKSIAERCGVSVSTVSLALSGKGKISPEQVKRIREAAEAEGYVPNPLLASLASKPFRSGLTVQGNLIAIFDFPSNPEAKNPSGLYTKFLYKWARELGYQPEIFGNRRRKSYKNIAESLYRRGTQGILFSGPPDPDLFRDSEKWSSFAMVQCGRYARNLPLHTVRPDIFHAVKLIFLKVLEYGYKRIGFAFGLHHPVLEDDEARHSAARAMQELHLSPEDRVPIYEGPIGESKESYEWLRRHKPDAVISFSVGFWYTLREAGYRIPEDIGFAVLHLNEKTEEQELSLTGLNQNREQIARRGVVLLDQLIRHNHCGAPASPRHYLIRSEWIPGKSLRSCGGTEADCQRFQ